MLSCYKVTLAGKKNGHEVVKEMACLFEMSLSICLRILAAKCLRISLKLLDTAMSYSTRGSINQRNHSCNIEDLSFVFTRPSCAYIKTWLLKTVYLRIKRIPATFMTDRKHKTAQTGCPNKCIGKALSGMSLTWPN